MFKELITEADGRQAIQKAWDNYQKACNKLDSCYNDNGNSLDWGKSLGGKKSGQTKTLKTLYKKIDAYYGTDSTGLISINIYTLLQNGKDLPKEI